jgi:hypothetical protein
MKSTRVFFILAIVLSGCASTSEPFRGLQAPSADKAVVYIYRVDSYVGGTRIAPNVRVNNDSLGPLLKYGYFRVEVNPGSAHVALYRLDKREDDTYWRAAQDAVVKLRLAPNSIHFVEFSLDKTLFSFRETSRDKALAVLPELRLLN